MRDVSFPKLLACLLFILGLIFTCPTDANAEAVDGKAIEAVNRQPKELLVQSKQFATVTTGAVDTSPVVLKCSRGLNAAWFMNGAARTGVGALPTATDLNWKIENRTLEIRR